MAGSRSAISSTLDTQRKNYVRMILAAQNPQQLAEYPDLVANKCGCLEIKIISRLVHRFSSFFDQLFNIAMRGRNVEFLLSLAIALDSLPGVHAIAGDTDGVDGVEEAVLLGGVLDVGAELQAVLDVVGDVALALGGVHHLGQAAQHHEVPVRLEIAGVARMKEALGVLGLRGGLGVPVVFAEQSRRLDEDLSRALDAQLDAKE